MKDFIVLLAILVFALIVGGVFLGLAGFEGNKDFICKKLFFAKKQCENLLIETELRRAVRG